MRRSTRQIDMDALNVRLRSNVQPIRESRLVQKEVSSIRPRDRIGNAFPYQLYMQGEGTPIPPRHGGRGLCHHAAPAAVWLHGRVGMFFIQLTGTFQSENGIYVLEIPPVRRWSPSATCSRRRCSCCGGVAQVWQGDREKLTFEWNDAACSPSRATPRTGCFNGGNEPAILMDVTAPAVINTLQDVDFVFNCDRDFGDLYLEDGTYFVASDLRTKKAGTTRRSGTPTSSLTRAVTDWNALEQKITGELTGHRMSQRFAHGHISQWPGRYHKAHYHGPAPSCWGWRARPRARLGFTAGHAPDQDGHGDEVFRVERGCTHSTARPTPTSTST